jgi:hypothetical protein
MLSIQPEMAGPNAVAKLLGVLVVADVAGHSGSVTTAMQRIQGSHRGIGCRDRRSDRPTVLRPAADLDRGRELIIR